MSLDLSASLGVPPLFLANWWARAVRLRFAAPNRTGRDRVWRQQKSRDDGITNRQLWDRGREREGDKMIEIERERVRESDRESERERDRGNSYDVPESLGVSREI
jgi:hypothetical protein